MQGREGRRSSRRGGPVASAHFRESRAPWPPPARSCQLAGAAEPVSAQARPLLGVCAARSTVRHHGGIGEAAARRDHGGPGLRQGHRVVAHHQTLRAEAPLQRGPAPPEHAAGHRWELRPRAGSVRSSRRGFAGRGRGSCDAGAAPPTSPGERASGLRGPLRVNCGGRGGTRKFKDRRKALGFVRGTTSDPAGSNCRGSA